jgi:hypothetical protein
MSWAISMVGTKSDVSAKAAAELDKIAANYEGKEEAKDVLAAKERILAIVEAVDLEEGWNAISVKATGSHSLSDKGITKAEMTIAIWRKHVD